MINNIEPDKPFKSLNEQVDIIYNDKKLTIVDEEKDKEFAKHALLTFSYYDLINGYKELFMVNDEFINNITIQYLYLFVQFDKSLQNILFQYSVIIENKFKTVLAYVISKRYGVFEEEYLNINNYNVRTNRERNKFNTLINKIKQIYQNNYYLEEPTKHYAETKNHIPAWILFKNLTFDKVTKLYKYLKHSDKLEVVNLMIDLNINEDKKLEYFLTSINLIRRCRNKIAHNLKFITYKDTTYQITKTNFGGDIHQILFDENSYNNIYGMIICINSMLNDEYLKLDMNNSINILINTYSDIDTQIVKDYLKITYIPNDYIERISKIIE